MQLFVNHSELLGRRVGYNYNKYILLHSPRHLERLHQGTDNCSEAKHILMLGWVEVGRSDAMIAGYKARLFATQLLYNNDNQD